jgi:hypothetical protein
MSTVTVTLFALAQALITTRTNFDALTENLTEAEERIRLKRWSNFFHI